MNDQSHHKTRSKWGFERYYCGWDSVWSHNVGVQAKTSLVFWSDESFWGTQWGYIPQPCAQGFAKISKQIVQKSNGKRATLSSRNLSKLPLNFCVQKCSPPSDAIISSMAFSSWFMMFSNSFGRGARSAAWVFGVMACTIESFCFRATGSPFLPSMHTGSSPSSPYCVWTTTFAAFLTYNSTAYHKSACELSCFGRCNLTLTAVIWFSNLLILLSMPQKSSLIGWGDPVAIRRCPLATMTAMISHSHD